MGSCSGMLPFRSVEYMVPANYAGKALWLHQAYCLEFLGVSTFMPGLFLASLVFFVVNVWILGIVVSDVGVVC